MTVAAFIVSLIALVISVIAIIETVRSQQPCFTVRLSSETTPRYFIVRNIGKREARNVRIVWKFDSANTHMPAEHWTWASLAPGQPVKVPIPGGNDEDVHEFHMMIENSLLRSNDRDTKLAGTITYTDPYVFWKKSAIQSVRLPVAVDRSAYDVPPTG